MVEDCSLISPNHVTHLVVVVVEAAAALGDVAEVDEEVRGGRLFLALKVASIFLLERSNLSIRLYFTNNSLIQTLT
jgi:hypothetical protein